MTGEAAPPLRAARAAPPPPQISGGAGARPGAPFATGRERGATGLAVWVLPTLMALAAAVAVNIPPAPAAEPNPYPYPIFDAHLHYSASAAAAYPVAEVLAKLRRAGVARALVSSSPDSGSLALRAAAPQRFLPFSRPYRRGVGPANWTADGETPAYVAGQLAKGVFGGIGEFHLDTAAAARRPAVRALARMAAERGLALHVHAGSGPVEELFAQQPGARILWAHVGFESDLAQVARMLGRYPRLLAETSFRAGEMLGSDGKLNPQWRRVLRAFPKRFMIGADTYRNFRWEDYRQIIAAHRQWLALLPPDAARAIAYRNAVREFGSGGLPELEQ